MPRKIRDKLCKECQNIVLESEREYKKKHPEIKKYKKKHYLNQKKEGKIKTSRTNIAEKEKLERIRNIIDKTPDEEI